MGSESIQRQFHSRYAPEEEARRHLDASLDGKSPSLVFIIGGGRNYLGACVAARLPGSTCVLLQPTADFDGSEVRAPELHWSPGSAEPLRSVIRAALRDESLAGGVAIIEWPPVVSRFSEASDRIRSTLVDELQKASADAATSAFWARRWLRNSLRFATGIRLAATIAKGDMPVVVACAGPGLMPRLDELRSMRGRFSLWALASAHAALSAAGLQTDLIIATDPGYWNGHHLYEAMRRGTPVAMPPSAFAPGRLFESSAIVPLDTGLSFERAALRAAGLTGLEAQASGTSAGTALALALASTTGTVAVLGLDLAALPASDHARPYAFDYLDWHGESRLQPEHSTRSKRIIDMYPLRVGLWRMSRSFSTYAATLAVEPAEARRVGRCSDSPVGLPIASETLTQTLSRAQSGPNPVRAGVVAGEAARKKSTRGMLTELVDDAQRLARVAVEQGRPIPYEAALVFKALDPRHSSELLAQAARGRADTKMLEAVVTATRAAAEELIAEPDETAGRRWRHG